MDLMEIAANLFKEHLGGAGGSLDLSSVKDALSSLLGTDGGDLDIAGLLSKVQSGGLAEMATSWLSSGGNDAMSVDQVGNLFGSDKIEEFAGKLGIDAGAAQEGLSNMIPDLIDKQSEGGALSSVVSGALGGLFK